MRGIIFRTAKAAFKKAFKKHKAEVKTAKKTKSPVVPYQMIKSDIKRQIRGTKFIAAAEFKAQPGLKRKIKIGIEKSKRDKKKFKKPVILGKAYQSDKAGKTMQVNPLTKQQRKLMLKEMAVSADKGYRKARFRKFGYEKGGDIKTLKNVAGKLQKASKAHAGQSKKLKKIISKYV
jgi:glucuronate isomerase